MSNHCGSKVQETANYNDTAHPRTYGQLTARDMVLPRYRPSFLRILVSLVLALAFFPTIGYRSSHAGEVTAPNRAGWQAGITSQGTVTFHRLNGINFGPTDTPVTLNRADVYMLGNDSALTSRITGLNSAILGQGQAWDRRSVDPAVFGAWLENQLQTFQVPSNMTYIRGDNKDATHRESDQALFDTHKIINFTKDTPGLLVQSLSFEDFLSIDQINSTGTIGVINPFIGSDNKNASTVSMQGFIDNAFKNIRITIEGPRDTQYLAGGGIIGLRATSEQTALPQNVEIGRIRGNYFSGLSVTTKKTAANSQGSPYIEGGGIIGVNGVSSPDLKSGHAEIDSFGYNYFSTITIISGDMLLGGGVVGVNNNSRNNDVDTYATLGSVKGNIFGNGKDGNITVMTEYSLRGGGVIGVNALSNAKTNLYNLDSNVFAGVDVEVGSYLRGGGVVGVQSKCSDTDPSTTKNNCEPSSILIDTDVPSYLGLADNNVFYNIEVEVGTRHKGAGLDGGGIIGVNSYNNSAVIGGVRNSLFKDIKVTVEATDGGDGELHGGGVVGASSLQTAAIDNLNDNYFDNITVNIAKSIHGGGVIGVSTSDVLFPDNMTYLGKVFNNTFKNSKVSADNIYGGGIIGIGAETGTATTIAFDDDNQVVAMDHNVFSALEVKSTHGINGGGVIGHYAKGGWALIGPIEYSDFYNENIQAAYIEGGGIVGAYSDEYALVYSLNSLNFINNKITVERYIDGGGIVGVTGNSAQSSAPLIGIHEIRDSYFVGNNVVAENGIIMGGLVYSYGTIGDGMTIEGTWFENNAFKATLNSTASYTSVYPGYTEKYGVYGTVTIDTGTIAGGDAAVVKLVSTPDSSVVFFNNTINATINGTESIRTNSLYFGGIPEYDYNNGTYSIKDDPPALDAKLVIDTSRGGSVGLFDPILVDQTGSMGNKYFKMEVIGAGHFIWGGNNMVYTDTDYRTTPNNVFNFSGGNTTILAGMTLEATNHMFSLGSAARLNVLGQNSFTVKQAYLNGALWFNLAAGTVNDVSTALLTVDSPNHVVVTGATVSLGDFPAGQGLKPGDRFYLIDSLKDNWITKDQNTKMATARQGLLTRYNFIVDNEDAVGGDGRYLVARLGYKAPQVDEPLVVYENSQTGEPLVVYTKTAVDVPLVVEFTSATDVPLKVEIREETGEPLMFHVKDAVGEPLFVQFETAVDNPEVVYVRSEVGEPLFQLVRNPQVDTPLVVYQNAETGEPLVVYTKEAVGDPLFVEVKAATGDPLMVQFIEETGEPLVVYSKYDVDTPLVVQFETAVDNPEVVYVRSEVGDPLFQLVRDPQVDTPLVVYESSQTGDPLVVYFKTAVDNPLMVEVKSATGDPLMVEIHEQTGEPLVVQVKDAVGEPLVVQIETAVDNPEVVYVKSATGEPLFKLWTPLTNNPFSNIVSPNDPLELIPETRLLTAGQAATVGLLNQTWLPDHSYESADMALRQSKKAFAPFVGLDFAMIETGRETKLRTNSGRLVAGMAWQRPADSSDFLLGVMLECVKGKYKLEANYGSLFGPNINAEGLITAGDIGMMVRQQWHGGLRLEASGRYGLVRNSFKSHVFDNALGNFMDYEMTTPFWSVHAGLGYEHRIGERSILDFVSRFYYTMLDSDSVALNSGEIVNFDSVASKRARGGLRYSFRHNERATFYAGGYWEQEFAGKSSGEHLNIRFSADELRGGTGIGEMGVSFRSTPDRPWDVEAGFQVYGGRSRGFSLGVRAGYEF
ncbi:MAG: hypothetical protein LBP92_07385 [Deltaproteobacteria bacterium]|jgi:hypothetical protein|nr:hypothetical protein [Deltaproteobacteria bacterium]